MGDVIRANTFARKNTVALARSLLGKVLVRGGAGRPTTRHLITETEAYHSASDLACHAAKGRTAGTDVLFRSGGIWYVYLCYGVHEMLNLVVGPEGFPAAILFRGLHDVTGPGRLTKALAIGRSLNGKAADPATGLWIEDEGIRVTAKWTRVTARIGVKYAGEVWAEKPWRFVVTPEGREHLMRRWAERR